MSPDPWIITFAEPDNMFRLAEVALTGTMTTHAERILDYFLGDEADRGAELILAASAHGVHPLEVRIREEGQALEELLPGTVVLVTEAERICATHLDLAPQLRLVQKFGSILDNIDVEHARARGIDVVPMRRITTTSSAEHTVMLMLALARQVVPSHEVVTRGSDLVLRPSRSTGVSATRFNWGQVRGIRILEGSTLGLVGFGEIAREVALRATALGMRIVFHQRSELDRTALDARLVDARQVTLDELFVTSDVVSVHVPGNASTERMLDASAFARMRPGSLLVNMSRGSVVDELALEESLRAGHLGGAGLDVHREEPVPLDCGLFALERVVMTPHVAGGSAWFVLSEVDQLTRELVDRMAGMVD